MSNSKQAVQNVFSEKSDFIIIGLTGRTGAGCSTAAGVLSKEYDELNFDYKEDVKSNHDRRERIIANYASSNWKSFKVIEVRNIITSFLLEENFEMLVSFIGTDLDTIIAADNIRDELMQNSAFIDNFNEMHKLRLEIKKDFEAKYGNQDSLLEADTVHTFYFQMLPEFSLSLRQELMKVNKDLYYKLFQAAGKNIRMSGHPYISKFEQDKIYIMPQRINKLIKILRQRNYKEKTGVRVVIDSLKNPYELAFFKDRYASFYCIALHCDESNRKRRLINDVKLSADDIVRIDTEEYAAKTTIEQQFYFQNVPMCYENSDIHIDNIEAEYKEYNDLKYNLIKYVSLIMHPGLVTPNHIERVMNIAYTAKVNSSCLSRKVGAVVTDSSFSTLSIGWNGAPEGQVGCNLRILDDVLKRRNRNDYSNFEISDVVFREKANAKNEKVQNSDMLGRLYAYCFKDIHHKGNQVHTRSLHAEENAFLQLIKSGVSNFKNAKLFTSASPCVLCSKKAYQLGIEEIYYIDQYPDISEEHILNQGEKRPKLIRFNGVIGGAYHKLYSPIIPYKDELNLMIEE